MQALCHSRKCKTFLFWVLQLCSILFYLKQSCSSKWMFLIFHSDFVENFFHLFQAFLHIQSMRVAIFKWLLVDKTMTQCQYSDSELSENCQHWKHFYYRFHSQSLIPYPVLYPANNELNKIQTLSLLFLILWILYGPFSKFNKLHHPH